MLGLKANMVDAARSQRLRDGYALNVRGDESRSLEDKVTSNFDSIRHGGSQVNEHQVGYEGRKLGIAVCWCLVAARLERSPNNIGS